MFPSLISKKRRLWSAIYRVATKIDSMHSSIASSIRRRFLGLIGLAGLYQPLHLLAQPAPIKLKPKSPPVWTGFGLNGGPMQARYNLTRR